MNLIDQPFGIPTTFMGVNFRSRLEASWACVFERGKIKWEYEPIDLPGWIPDFVLYGRTNLYVEIKPIREFDQALVSKLSVYLNQNQIHGEILILGNFVEPSMEFPDIPTSGWLVGSTERDNILLDSEENAGCCLMDVAGYSDFGFCCRKKPCMMDAFASASEMAWTMMRNGQLDFCSTLDSYHSRLTGYYEGNPVGDEKLTVRQMTNRWRQARNETQWKRN